MMTRTAVPPTVNGPRSPRLSRGRGRAWNAATAGPRAKASVVTAALFLLLAVLTGCGEEEPPVAPVPEGLGEVTIGADGVQEVTLQTQDDYVFTPDTFTVAPGRVRLTVVNVADQMAHNLMFTEEELPAPIAEEIPLLTPGEEQTIEFEVTTPGDYPFSCTFHLQLGQVGTMTVSE